MAPGLLVRLRPGMMASTLAKWHRLAERFEAFRRSRPGHPVAETAQAWLRTLTASQQGIARCALKRHLGVTACQWDTLEITRYHRDEPALAASVLDADMRNRVRAATRGAKELALIECLFTARRFEVAALTWADIDLAATTMRIRHGKGGKPATTLLTPGAAAALGQWFVESGEPPDTTPVFPVPHGVGHPHKVGQPYTPGGISQIVRKILTRADCWAPGRGGAHRFRRTFATEYLRANPQDLIALKDLMRHASVTTTQKYVYFAPEDLSARMARVRL